MLDASYYQKTDEIIAMHGGTLEIYSKEQVGTRVVIRLPLGDG